jgi:hypothetical protein
MDCTFQDDIKQILSLPPITQRPSQAICDIIANLQDLCEIQGMTIRAEWRRATPDNQYRFSGSPGDSTPRRNGFRSNGETPISRVSSASSISASPPPPVPKYQSKFKNSNQPVDDKILNNIILSKLNKFSAKTYNEIRDFLYQILGSGEPGLQEMIPHFMKLVFRKAAIEEIFCPLYAKLLSEISAKYSVILDEMHTLQANYMDIFDDIHEPESKDYALYVENQKAKEYRKGYSQFLAELTALEILDLNVLNTTFQCILKNMTHFGKMDDNKTLLEGYSDCLFRMAKVLKKKTTPFFIGARQTLLASNGTVLEHMINNKSEYVSESAKTRFILMDIYDILKGV